MKIENTELNEIPPPIEKILEFDVEDFHFRMSIMCSETFDEFEKIICQVTHKPMETILKMESEPFDRNDVVAHWEKLREQFVRTAIASKHLFAKPINSIKLTVV